MDYFEGNDYDWSQEGMVPAAPPITPYQQAVDQQITRLNGLIDRLWETELLADGAGFAGQYFTTAPASLNGVPVNESDATTSGTYAGITRSLTPMWASNPVPAAGQWISGYYHNAFDPPISYHYPTESAVLTNLLEDE